MPKITINPEGLINKSYLPYWFKNKKTIIKFGGSSSGKSVDTAMELIAGVLAGRNVLVVRKVAKALKGSAWNEIKKAMINMGVANLFDISKTEMLITAKNNGCQFLFSGLDDTEKVKSITPQTGALTDIWIEEATEIEYEDYKQLEKRLRGLTKHPKRIIMTFNPIYKTHWIYTTFFNQWTDEMTRFENDDLLIIKTTHKDNEFLTAEDHERLENEKDEYYYNVYTLGNWGVLGDVIFKNWKLADLNEPVEIQGQQIPLWKTFDNIRNGLDFGFSADPFAFVRLHIDKMRKKIYVFKELYERGYTNSMIADEIKPIIKSEQIICDSAEPKSIQELNNYGIRAIGAMKGADSVVYGIQWLQGYEIIVDIRCQNMKNELELYQWKKDKDGNSMKQPVDKNNHLIDALRYALSLDMEDIKPAMARFSSIRL